MNISVFRTKLMYILCNIFLYNFLVGICDLSRFQENIRVKPEEHFIPQGNFSGQWRAGRGRRGATAPAGNFLGTQKEKGALNNFDTLQCRFLTLWFLSNLPLKSRKWHFRDSKFKKFLGSMPPDPPRKTSQLWGSPRFFGCRSPSVTLYGRIIYW